MRSTNIKFIVILKALIHRIQIAYIHLKSGDHHHIYQGLIARIYSKVTSFGLEYDNRGSTYNTLASNTLNIRIFNSNDINQLQEKMRHIRLVEADIQTCYIAEDEQQQAVFRQWVFKHDQNHRIKNYFGNLFPKLETNEALLEGGFTHPDYRGQSIMAKSILNIINLKENKDIHRYITFVDKDNIASIKGLYKAGFRPYILRQESWFLFRREVTYTPLYVDISKTVLA